MVRSSDRAGPYPIFLASQKVKLLYEVRAFQSIVVLFSQDEALYYTLTSPPLPITVHVTAVDLPPFPPSPPLLPLPFLLVSRFSDCCDSAGVYQLGDRLPADEGVLWQVRLLHKESGGCSCSLQNGASHKVRIFRHVSCVH